MRAAVALFLLLTALGIAAPDVVIHLTSRTQFITEPPSEHENVQPLELTVTVGTTVRWTVDEGKHEIVARNGSFHSEVLNEGMQFEHTFDRPGTWAYDDMFHLGGPQKALAGVVRVIPPSPPASR